RREGQRLTAMLAVPRFCGRMIKGRDPERVAPLCYGDVSAPKSARSLLAFAHPLRDRLWDGRVAVCAMPHATGW
ncbi:MAG: hypothetical protein AAFY66_15875, partial [Pseudomonadota bacterium]